MTDKKITDLNEKCKDTQDNKEGATSKYEMKQAARKARYAEKVKKLHAEEAALHEKNRSELQHIVPGQPILLGHHSEKEHRRLLAQARKRIIKAIEIGEKADYYERRANIVSHAISSEDENAIVKLKEKLADKENLQLEMKRANKEFRKGGIDAITNISDETRMEIKDFLAACPYENSPYPTFKMSNNNANIRRIKTRIVQLEKESARQEPEPIKTNGFVITENKEDVRLWVQFDSKPEKEVCQIMRQYGFKWSPTRKAWVRLLNDAARSAVKSACKEINALEKQSWD